jgi:hypothetical protein
VLEGEKSRVERLARKSFGGFPDIDRKCEPLGMLVAGLSIDGITEK